MFSQETIAWENRLIDEQAEHDRAMEKQQAEESQGEYESLRYELSQYKAALALIAALPAVRQDECSNVAMNALDEFE